MDVGEAFRAAVGDACGDRVPAGLSRSAAAAIELLGDAFAGTVVSDRFSAYNDLPTHQRQLRQAHLKRDLTAVADRTGASGQIGAELLGLQRQLFEHWHQWKAGAMDWLALQRSCQPIRLAFEQTLQRVVELGCQRKEQSPSARTVRTCQQLLKQKQARWTFLETPGIEHTNNAAERALRQQGRDVWQFLEQSWIAHHRGGVMPSLLPDR